ncbi:unnamed protein product [Schistocephalus solidus]|uniref:Ephrin_rec_like domain-containing protein n=1 Tax=Schistocephalus solidus TaxID=70667 RepID=A0A183T710_SCHSO|nr:unnamed protein product [Schistocephalus solidus]
MNLRILVSYLAHLIVVNVLLRSFVACKKVESKFSAWIPNGQLVQIPCNLDEEKYKSLIGKQGSLTPFQILGANLLRPLSSDVTTVWYNALGRIIHVGSALPLRLPPVMPGEVELEALQVNIESKPGMKNTLYLPPHRYSDTGSSLDILRRYSMTTVTCQTFRSSTSGIVWGSEEEEEKDTDFSEKHVIHRSQFILTEYAQPIIQWRYALPRQYLNETEKKRYLPPSWWEDVARNFCRSLQNVHEFRFTPCIHVEVVKLPYHLKYSDSYYELLVTIRLGTTPFHVLLSPTATSFDSLAAVHAASKHLLDELLRHELDSKLRTQGMQVKDKTKITFLTAVRFLCPPGSYVRNSGPPLKPIFHLFQMKKAFEDIYDNTSELIGMPPTASAILLQQMPPVCVACPPGQAPLTAYSFDRCRPCARAFYRGITGWPASGGCLPCPDGFTTGREGSLSPDDCKLNGGTYTQALAGFATWAYDNFAALVVAYHEASSSYRSHVAYFLGESETQESAAESLTSWINCISPKALAAGIASCLLLLFLLSLFVYRLSLLVRFLRAHHKYVRLLRRVIYFGHLNLQDDVRNILRMEYVEGVDPQGRPSADFRGSEMLGPDLDFLAKSNDPRFSQTR